HTIHTHGGPACMPGRLERRVDAAWLDDAVRIAAGTVVTALEEQAEVRLRLGAAQDPGVAKNRRRPDGPVDRLIPVAALEAADRRIATVVSHACHPVVLGPDNRRYTADYPGVVRQLVERAHPGSICLFLTGCAGDVNTGHSAADSMRGAVSARRTFAEAERIGAVLADAVISASLAPSTTEQVWARRAPVTLAMEPEGPLEELASRFGELSRSADAAADRALYSAWSAWAAEQARDPGPTSWNGSVGLLAWGDLRLAALPGEPFSAVATAIREALGHPEAMVAGYTNGCPGYLPTESEYPLGGYEVGDAHRYYGAAGPFRRGSAEELVAAITRLARL
ncbi:MAG: hypothetical protein KIT69_20525, partial [Propionibacteriaceae bacterium]|nr:hypothetical protein [Propionibacteriaceae bacterium]